MNPFRLLPFVLLWVSSTIAAQQVKEAKAINTQPFSIGETVEIYSQELAENRILNIYLPIGYSPDSLKKPGMFNNYIIVSPSLWWDDESLLKTVPKPLNSNQTTYIAVGKEGEVMERVAKELTEKLKQENESEPKIYFDYLGDQDHGNILHLAVYQAFQKVFKTDENQKER